MIKIAKCLSLWYYPSSFKIVKSEDLAEIANIERRKVIKKLKNGFYKVIVLPDLLLYVDIDGTSHPFPIQKYFQKKLGANGKPGKLTEKRRKLIEKAMPREIGIIQAQKDGESSFELPETEMERWYQKMFPQGELELFR